MEATITSKGQVTLPKALRDKYDLKEGQKLVFIENADGTLSIIVRRNNLEAIIGILKPRIGTPASISDLNEGIIAGAVASYERSIR